jgi:leucyl-tRNA synthetase
VHNENGESKALDLEELPLLLPEVADYEPSDSGEAPLKNNTEWINTKEGERESHTMPGSAGSSWYFLRYPDTQNETALCSEEKLNYWLPVDLYVGGPEHTVGHLLYSRFWTKFLNKEGLINFDEPFKKLAHQGMILGTDGEKMSKSRGNVVNPDEVKVEFGVDAVRVYIAFMGPFEKEKPWSTKNIEGSKRFLDRIYRLCVHESKSIVTDTALDDELKSSLHKCIKKVTKDIENMSFNTAVSAMMILVNDLYKKKSHSREALEPLIKLLNPFAPHLAQEIWSVIAKKDSQALVAKTTWPSFDEALCTESLVEMGVQVNGKMRGTIKVQATTSEDEALKLAKAQESINSYLENKEQVKVIYKATRILNIIVKG